MNLTGTLFLPWEPVPSFYAHHRAECRPKEPDGSECDLTPNGLKLRAQGRASKFVDGRKNKLLQELVLCLHQGG